MPHYCYVCGVALDVPAAYGAKAGPASHAARVILGIGLVEVCGERCAADPKFVEGLTMKITIDATPDELDAIANAIASKVAFRLQPILTGVTEAMSSSQSAMTALQSQVAQNTSVVQSAIVLINGISDRIKSAGTDPAALQALTAELDSQDQALASAVTANTAAPASSGGGATDPSSGGGGATDPASGGGTAPSA
jgi:hypothetical protein